MQNVVFKIKRDGSDYERKGFTHIDEEYLYLPKKKKDGSIEYEPWDCIRYCHPIIGKPNQFKGYYTAYEEVEFFKDNKYQTVELEVTYRIWYMIK